MFGAELVVVDVPDTLGDVEGEVDGDEDRSYACLETVGDRCRCLAAASGDTPRDFDGDRLRSNARRSAAARATERLARAKKFAACGLVSFTRGSGSRHGCMERRGEESTKGPLPTFVAAHVSTEFSAGRLHAAEQLRLTVGPRCRRSYVLKLSICSLSRSSHSSVVINITSHG
jgi:hypothetical protein